MNQQILDYIKNQRIGVFAVEMLDGSPHAATLHFANSDSPLVFYFRTEKTYRKSESLIKNTETRGSFVVGVDEANMQTFQADGIARLVISSELEVFEKIYLSKFPEKKKTDLDKSIVFSFTPTWWRYTNFNGPNGKLIISSEDK